MVCTPDAAVMLDCPDLAVPKEVMQHVVYVESSRNPFAIGVVGGYLARQPRNLEEALASVRQLKEEGYNFSVGISQVNRYNLAKYGLRTYAEAFEICPNLQAGSRILRECYDRAQDWGKAFSCYYSGNFVTGFEQGYVQKIFASIRKSQAEQAAPDAIRVIPYGNGLRKPARDDGLPLGGQSGSGASTITANVPAYPEPASLRRVQTVANMDTAEARPAIPVPGPGAVMPGNAKSRALDLSQIPTQVVGVDGDPYKTRVMGTVPSAATQPALPLPNPAAQQGAAFKGATGQPRGSGLASAQARKGGKLLSANELPVESRPESTWPATSKGPEGKVNPSDKSFVF